MRAAGATVYGEEAALAAIACEQLAVVQVAMNALDRAPEARVMPAAQRAGTALVARSALLRGVLTPAGRALSGPFAPLRERTDRFRLACGATWDELPGAAVAFLLGRPGPACVLLGPRDAAELDALRRRGGALRGRDRPPRRGLGRGPRPRAAGPAALAGAGGRGVMAERARRGGGRRWPGAQREAALLVCMFHLNLAFSSLVPERQAHVVQACYWPMLRLAEETPFPIAFEATGWTLERIAEHDPAWIARARELIDAGRVELVGSGYAQCAAPLLPAEVNRWNLRLGFEAYERLLGTRPALALVCEQAYSPGLVQIYAEAGAEAMIVDWDNAYRSNLGWDDDVRRQPQRALGSGGASLPVVWSESIAFQKFQRYAHDELSLERYVEFIAGAVAEGRGALMLYANDAEVFDHRPGRFAAEPKMADGEWDRVALALRTLSDAAIGTPALPRDVLALLDRPGAGRELRLEAPDQPIPVKKQDKYNITRWAVSGRDDVGINTRCQRVFERLRDGAIDDPAAWRRLCELWASDFRTHIGDARWEAMQRLLAQAETDAGVSAPAPAPAPPPAGATATLPDEVTRDGRLWRVRSGHLDVSLNARRGLAIEAFADDRIGPETLFGTLEHGYFPTIELGADWYTGDVVQEAPLRHKVTDLEPMAPRFERTEDGVIRAFGRLSDRTRGRREARGDRRGGGHGHDRHDAALARAAARIAARGAPRAAPRGVSSRRSLLRHAQRRPRARAPRARRLRRVRPRRAGLGARLLPAGARRHRRRAAARRPQARRPRRDRPRRLQAAGDRRLHPRRRAPVLSRRAEHHRGRRHAAGRDRAQRR